MLPRAFRQFGPLPSRVRFLPGNRIIFSPATTVHSPPQHSIQPATPFTTKTGLLHQRILDDDWPLLRPSKRVPTMETTCNRADNLERLLQKDGFKTWGFVIYRCTYDSDLDWQKFLDFYMSGVKASLKFYGGLDLLDSFAPTVLEDPSFKSAKVTELREHFNTWALEAMQREQNITVARAHKYYPYSGRYRFFIMVDQAALQSVLNAPDKKLRKKAFVRLVNTEWEPQVLDEDEIEALGGPLDEFEPLEGCTLEDVGWMLMPFNQAGLTAFHHVRDTVDFDFYYCRPPEMQSLTLFERILIEGFEAS
ncbi:hypothetical protein N7468_000027 [Penicillium chermesinum]|uniref:Uncharacterized protein n=1 Tax=Penicillium chermesinum TaxID=63820 RepID=A0A9W9PJK1_9EURO|nr:uncharacterized protein N7468_000027 [Penicillium chermesinum]KAJ5248576.1 hypothetical protein N7468_000027 [Penicillium chermesinum]KAJ6150690.1 hypothetical protein N7470_007284 [Penicillium chermesinum]